MDCELPDMNQARARSQLLIAREDCLSDGQKTLTIQYRSKKIISSDCLISTVFLLKNRKFPWHFFSKKP
jgi:hypothetical protein